MTRSMTQPVIAIFDLDQTITRSDTYAAFLIHFLVRNPGRILKSIWLPFALALHKLGARDNSWLKKVFLHSIAGGASREAIERCSDRFLRDIFANEIRPGAKLVIRRHREAGDFLLMATASFDFYAQRLGEYLGFDDIIATNSKWNLAGQLTGSIDGNNCYGAAKLARVNSYIDLWEKRPYTVAYTDHHSDTSLLAWADQPVVVNPKPTLLEIAIKEGYEIQDWEII